MSRCRGLHCCMLDAKTNGPHAPDDDHSHAIQSWIAFDSGTTHASSSREIMLQSSITAWLKKPLGVREPAISIPLSKPESTLAPSPNTPPPSHGQPSTLRSVPPSLPSNVTLSPITKELIPAFKRVNQLLLQIPYPKKFYDELLEDDITKSISRVALWKDEGQSTSPKSQLVASIRCRLLGPPSDRMLYISTLTCLSPYRGHGLVTVLLMDVTSRALELYGIKSITAHVWEANEEGRTWYRNRGFTEEAREDGYYRKLNPTTALLVRKWVSSLDLTPTGGLALDAKGADEQENKD